MSSSGLGNLAVWPGLDSMDQVRELDGILNKEDGDVVTNNIWIKLVWFHRSTSSGCLTKVAFVRVKPDGKSMHIANGISRTSTSSDCREAEKYGRLLVCGTQERRSSNV
jgi:hypothetical protein